MTLPPGGQPTSSTLPASAWCVVGGGNMASALVLGAVESGVISADRFAIVEVDATKREFFASRGIACFASIREGLERIASIEAAPGDGHVLLAVKPQALEVVATELRPLVSGAIAGRRVVSILAGTPTSRLESLLGERARVIRVMPNTPARIRRGTSAIARGASCRTNDEREIEAFMGALGTVVALDETLFDAFTAIAGSGPAYLFYLAEGLIRAAIAQGFTQEQADQIVRSMLAGSADLLEREESQTAAAMRLAVTSKGGTTAAAVGVLDDANVMDTLTKAIAAATARGRELAEG